MDGGDPPLMTPPPRTPTSPHRIVNRNGWRKRRLCGSRVGKRLICVGAGGNAGESRKGRMTLGERDLTCQDKLNITVVVWKWWESETGSIGLDRVCVDFRRPLFAEPRLPRQSQRFSGWFLARTYAYNKDCCHRRLNLTRRLHLSPPPRFPLQPLTNPQNSLHTSLPLPDPPHPGRVQYCTTFPPPPLPGRTPH